MCRRGQATGGRRMMHVVHLTASRFLGGPERQIIGLSKHLAADAFRSTLLSFRENGCCSEFIEAARRQGLAADALKHDMPRLRAAYRELVERLRAEQADVLCCHGYKSNLLGRLAARRV